MAATAAAAAAPEGPQAPVDRVKLFVDQGSEAGWESESLAQALASLAGQARETVLALELRPRHAYVVVRPDASEAYLAAHKKPLKEKPVSIEVARPRRR